MTTGEKIRAARKAKGLTQAELGKRAGMKDSAIRKYESGGREPKIETLRRIANGLGVDWKDILEDDELPKKMGTENGIGERIRALRACEDITQVDFGKRIGVKGNTITNYEKGLRTPSDAIILSICREFNVDKAWLIYGIENGWPAEHDIEQLIGTPATLEQLAEECAELGQAALKLARKMRGENPTPKTQDELLENLTEEVADVLLCIEQVNLDADKIESVKAYKAARWRQRIEDMNHEN